jgi:hypothetical protein
MPAGSLESVAARERRITAKTWHPPAATTEDRRTQKHCDEVVGPRGLSNVVDINPAIRGGFAAARRRKRSIWRRR